MFKNKIELMPFPADADLLLQQSREIETLVAQSSVAALKQTAMTDILSEDGTGTPSETARLRRLYKDVYTVAELEGLIDRTFAKLGFAS